VSHVSYELRFYIPEDDSLHSHRSENLKSYKLSAVYVPARSTPVTAGCNIHSRVGNFIPLSSTRFDEGSGHIFPSTVTSYCLVLVETVAAECADRVTIACSIHSTSRFMC
jgi:hypothetical protein